MYAQIEIVMSSLVIACIYLLYKNKQAIKLTNKLKAEKLQLQEMNQTKGEALSNISHEIRTPISAILGIQEKILRGKNLPLHDEKILASVHASTYSMLDILNQVLDAEKISKGKLQLEEEACDLKNLLKHIQRTFSESINSEKLKFTVIICSEIANSLLIDSTRLGQVLHNLLSNATKQTESGQINLVTRVLANDHFGQIIHFELADTGSGMTSDDIQRLRMPYEQNLQNRQQFHQLGSGLGLPITEHLLMLMGSYLNIESELHLGSSFSFSLAFKRSIEEPRYGVMQTLPNSMVDPIPINKTVLVVDDHTPSRLITETQFKDMGYCVHGLSDASKAILLMNNQPFDMVVTDFSMPGLNGYQFAQQIRKLDHGKDIQILGITAHIDGANELLKEECNFDHILLKPASIKDWQREINFKNNYIKSLEKLAKANNQIYRIIAEEILIHQSTTLNQLLSNTEEICKHGNNHEVSVIAHKLLSGAKLTNDETLIKICERFGKRSIFITESHLIELCIALKQSNRTLKKILESY